MLMNGLLVVPLINRLKTSLILNPKIKSCASLIDGALRVLLNPIKHRKREKSTNSRV
jgi:hypothetical protein